MVAKPVHLGSHCTVKCGIPCYFAARLTLVVPKWRVTRICADDWSEIPRNRRSVPCARGIFAQFGQDSRFSGLKNENYAAKFAEAGNWKLRQVSQFLDSRDPQRLCRGWFSTASFHSLERCSLNLHSSDSDVLESERSHANCVEDVLCVHDQRTAENALDAIEVQAAEL